MRIKQGYSLIVGVCLSLSLHADTSCSAPVVTNTHDTLVIIYAALAAQNHAQLDNYYAIKALNIELRAKRDAHAN